MSDCYPIVFTVKRMIAGNGFLVGVIARGRALMLQEEEGYWVSGVNPCSVAGGGSDPKSAFCAFRDGYVSVLFDIASEARTFDAFKAEAEAFFNSVNSQTDAEWHAALKRVRA